MSTSTWLCPHDYSELFVVDVEVDIEAAVQVGVEVDFIEYFVSQYMALSTWLCPQRCLLLLRAMCGGC